jgi:hypothetical protein
MKLFFSVLLKYLLLVTSSVNSKLFLLMSENFEDCTEGGAKFVDFSGIEFEYTNDTHYYLSGKQLFDLIFTDFSLTFMF